MTTKVRPNITVDEDVWKYWLSRKEINKSELINGFLKERMELEVAEERQ